MSVNERFLHYTGNPADTDKARPKPVHPQHNIVIVITLKMTNSKSVPHIQHENDLKLWPTFTSPCRLHNDNIGVTEKLS